VLGKGSGLGVMVKVWKFAKEKSPMKLRIGSVVVAFLLFVLSLAAQTANDGSTSSQVPPLIPFASVATDQGGSSLSGVVNITFSLYAAQQGGEPLWTETQNNIQPDATGHYSVQLGITKPNGMPTALFTTTEARWLGVQIAEQGEQPRVLLLSVPYALKAGDAATIGGLPPSAFVLAAPGSGSAQAAPQETGATPQSSSTPANADVTGLGTIGYIPLWDATGDIVDSVLFQSATSPYKIGINNPTPAATLDIAGTSIVRGTFELPNTGTATATAGKNSQPFLQIASAFNSTAAKAVNQTFEWEAEAVNNDTATASATLNLLFGSGTTKPAETGLNIASNGVITFNATQTFPNTLSGITTAAGSGLTGGVTSGTSALSLLTSCTPNQVLQWSGTAWACATVGGGSGGSGTVTSVATGTGLLGGPITTSGTLTIDTTKVPLLGTANTFTGNQTVTGNVISTAGYEIQFAGTNYLFDYGSPSSGAGLGNSYLGFAGNATTTGADNVAAGWAALLANKTGADNTAFGVSALFTNSSGINNTAVGMDALFATGGGSTTTGNGNTAMGYKAAYSNNTGYSNTALGAQALYDNVGGVYNTATGANALYNNTTGNYNTALGYQAGPSTGALTNTTAIGANALVSESNALVLGGTGSNAVNVGIGTASPAFNLDVHGTANFTGLVTFAPTQTFSGGGELQGPVINATTSFDIGGTPFAFGSMATYNAFLGFSGNSTVTGINNFADGPNDLNALSTGAANTAVGTAAAINVTTGSDNTAVGINALVNDTGGYQNTAVGAFAAQNTNGYANTAVGMYALSNDQVGSGNTALGFAAGPDSASTGLINATAIGSNATVSASNSLVLGQTTAGSPGKAFVNVGIGTATPRSILEASVYAPSPGSGVEGLGPTITLTNSAGGGSTATSLDFNSYPPSTTGTYNPSARILVEDAGQFSDNILFQSNVPTAPNKGLQTNMEITDYGQVLIGGQHAVGDGLISQNILGYDLLSIEQIYPETENTSTFQFSNVDVVGVYGFNANAGSNQNGGAGLTASGGWGDSTDSGAVGGEGIIAYPGCVGVFLDATCVDAGYFGGNVQITGTLNGGTPSTVQIDHPLDAANKYLVHASVQSSEMMNIYTGNVTTDGAGQATVQLPDWFEAVNTDFRYQLTVIGQFAQAIVNSKVAGHQFGIKTDKPNVEVSWQITGVRNDAYAKAHPLVVEPAKNARERGYYLHPELNGASQAQNMEWARHPAMMRKTQIMRARQSSGTNSQKTAHATLPLAVPPNPKPIEPSAHPVRRAPVNPGAGQKPAVRAALQP
jgi:hypothetical protein